MTLAVVYFVQTPWLCLAGGFLMGFFAAGGVLQLVTAVANEMFPKNRGVITSIVMISFSIANYVVLNVAGLLTKVGGTDGPRLVVVFNMSQKHPITISSWTLGDQCTFEERVKAAKDAGFEGIGLRSETYVDALNEGLFDADILATLEKYGVRCTEVEYIVQWVEEHRSYEQKYKEQMCFHMCELFGVEQINCGLMENYSVEYTAQKLRELCHRAGKYVIGVEPMPYSGPPRPAGGHRHGGDTLRPRVSGQHLYLPAHQQPHRRVWRAALKTGCAWQNLSLRISAARPGAISPSSAASMPATRSPADRPYRTRRRWRRTWSRSAAWTRSMSPAPSIWRTS